MWVMIAVLIVYSKNMEKLDSEYPSMDFALLAMMTSILTNETLLLYHRTML